MSTLPKVDPDSHEPMSDDPQQASDEARGGKLPGDPGKPDSANPQGSDAPTRRSHDDKIT